MPSTRCESANHPLTKNDEIAISSRTIEPLFPSHYPVDCRRSGRWNSNQRGAAIFANCQRLVMLESRAKSVLCNRRVRWMYGLCHRTRQIGDFNSRYHIFTEYHFNLFTIHDNPNRKRKKNTYRFHSSKTNSTKIIVFLPNISNKYSSLLFGFLSVKYFVISAQIRFCIVRIILIIFQVLFFRHH